MINIAPQRRAGKIDDLNDLRAALIHRAADLAEALLGKPNAAIKCKNEKRWGRKGSMAVAVAGPKAGLWADHETGDGGDLFALIIRERGGKFSDAVKYARDFCGMRDNIKTTARPSSSHEGDLDDDQRAQRAVQRFAEAGSVTHPIARRYLERPADVAR